MTINMISDLHILPRQVYSKTKPLFINDFGKFIPEHLKPADYLIIAGDLGTCDNYKSVKEELQKRTAGLFKKIYCIPGNHDYWTATGKRMAPEDEFVEVNLDDFTVLLGCTMWTPIPEYRPDSGTWHSSSEFLIHSRMNDFRRIPNFSIKKHNTNFTLANTWLHDRVKAHAGKKIVIMTHHSPRKELISQKYLNNPLNYAYFVFNGACDDLHPDVWLSGHAHSTVDVMLDGTRFIRNPIGYHNFGDYEFIPECPVTNWYNKIIQI